MNESDRILITGAAGFLGRHLTDYLVAQLPHAKLFSLGLSAPAHPGTAHFECDMTRSSEVGALFEQIRPTQIYHLAGSSRVSSDIGVPEYFQSNVLTTDSLAKAIEQSRRPAALFLSSSVHVYGNRADEADESTVPAPISPYGFTKFLAEQTVLALARRVPHIRVIIGRLYSCIGPGQPEGFVTSDLARRLAQLGDRSDGVLTTGPLSGYRRFLDARDAVSVFTRLLECPQLKSGEIVNIASTHEISIREMVELLIKVSGKSPRVESQTSREANQFMGLKIRLDKMQNAVPGATFRPLEDSLRDIWFAAQPS